MLQKLDNALPVILLTMGDPSGIGPEIVLKALADSEIASLARFIVVGDERVVRLAATTGVGLTDAEIHHVPILESVADFTFGKLDARYGRAAVEYVRIAAEMCLANRADAMVTAPINKEAVTMSGRPFSGHTEYIAEICGERSNPECCSRARVSQPCTSQPMCRYAVRAN